MFVEYDTEIPLPREHPWTVVEGKPESKYWDFKALLFAETLTDRRISNLLQYPSAILV
ncbi:MAG: hypothetical protein ABSG23_14665 [Terriglobales bacterium]|jgi:hypothetical protein